MAIESELAAAGTTRTTNPSITGINSLVVVGHQAVLYGYDGRNTDTAAGCYIMTFDATSLPANGTLPVTCVGVPEAGNGATVTDQGNFGWTSACSWGEQYVNGIVIAASSTDATSGLTVLTSNKMFFHVQFASEDGLSSR